MDPQRHLLDERGPAPSPGRRAASPVLMGEAELFELSRRQHGVVTTTQAEAVLSRGQVRARLRQGRLLPVRIGVIAVAGVPATWEQQLMAAVLAGGDGAVASFRSAARLWALGPREDRIEITVPRARRARLPGVVVHDTTVDGTIHRGVIQGIAVTSPARTLCDLTACWFPWDVEHALDEALRQRLTSLTRLQRVFLDLANRGRRRSTVMRALLEARLPGFDPGDSDMEVRLVRWITGAGLPRPVQQHWVRAGGHAFRLDLAFPELMIGIEYDGWDPHRGRRAFDRDRARQNPLEIIGWLILRYTSASTREVVVREVADAIAARSSEPPCPPTR